MDGLRNATGTHPECSAGPAQGTVSRPSSQNALAIGEVIDEDESELALASSWWASSPLRMTMSTTSRSVGWSTRHDAIVKLSHHRYSHFGTFNTNDNLARRQTVSHRLRIRWVRPHILRWISIRPHWAYPSLRRRRPEASSFPWPLILIPPGNEEVLRS